MQENVLDFINQKSVGSTYPNKPKKLKSSWPAEYLAQHARGPLKNTYLVATKHGFLIKRFKTAEKAKQYQDQYDPANTTNIHQEEAKMADRELITFERSGTHLPHGFHEREEKRVCDELDRLNLQHLAKQHKAVASSKLKHAEKRIAKNFNLEELL